MQLRIEKLIYGGDGLARLPADEHGKGKAVFMPFVLEDETVEAEIVEQKPGFARARAETIVNRSPHRVEAGCPYFRQCGGCQYQHIDYEHQLATKAAILRENLHRIAKIELDTELVSHPSPPWNYRNRTRLKVQGNSVGYYRFNSHQLQPVEQCPISSPLINRAIAALSGGEPADWQKFVREIELFANSDDTKLLVEVDCAPEIRDGAAVAKELHGVLPEFAGVAVFRSDVRSRERKQIASSGDTHLQYRVENDEYRVSAGAFFQVNRHQIATLVKLVTQGLSGEHALDLYAGVGLFSTVLSKSFAQVTGVEPSPTAHADLLYNSPSNVKAVRATTEQFLKDAGTRLRPNLVVVDPPRSGLGEMVVRKLAGMEAGTIVYVSCDPATLSRDLAGLLKAGYRVQQAHVVDLFPQTYHIESVFHLTR